MPVGSKQCVSEDMEKRKGGKKKGREEAKAGTLKAGEMGRTAGGRMTRGWRGRRRAGEVDGRR